MNQTQAIWKTKEQPIEQNKENSNEQLREHQEFNKEMRVQEFNDVKTPQNKVKLSDLNEQSWSEMASSGGK